ncbi:flagellar hook-length control protein FliK [Luteimonas sp. A611]
MTGAGAMSLASASPAPAPPTRGAARSDGAAQPPADASAPDASARADRGKAAEGVAKSGEQAEDAAPAPAQSFAQFLLQAPPAAPPPAPAADAPAAGSESDATSPEQLLALLDGSWSGTAAAASAPGATAATAVIAQPAAGLSASATVTGTAAAAPTLDGEPASAGADHALPLLAADGDAPSTLAASPALEAAATARDASAATQAGPAIEAATAGIAGTTPLATPRPQAAPALPPLPMPANPDAGFDEGFGTRLVWMAEQRVGHAEIRLNPEHVGPIEVRVQLDGEQVRAEFHSAHAEVRQAIEASLPRLRELLAQHGLQLGQADVGQGQAGRDGDAARAGATARRGQGGEPGDPGQTPTPPAALRTRGLLDEYA